MRIITGTARGMKLYTLDGESTRPTSERTKEALFSMLHFDLEGREILDLFGGSGQLSLEALSRGAAHATIVDESKAAVDIIHRNAQKTRLTDKCTVVRSDYNAFLASVARRAQYDIIFLDPPYSQKLIPSVLENLIKYSLIKPTTIIACETVDGNVFGNRAYLSDEYDIIKESKYGIAHITLLNPRTKER